jgi:hypothetical protein
MKIVAGIALAAVLTGTLAACGGGTSAPAPQAQAPAAPSLPTVDTAGAQGLLSPDETLQVVSMPPAGSTTVSGTVAGYESNSYAVPVAAGQTLRVDFQRSNTNLYMNIHDTADQSGAAVHRGEFDGPGAALTPSAPTTYLIRPFQPRAEARRNETGSYTIQISRN